MKAQWLEWVVAQELWRRAAIAGSTDEDSICYWQSKNNEIDFVYNGSSMLEVKAGAASPSDFLWFTNVFPGRRLTVICAQRFETSFCTGMTLDDFLREQDR